MSEFVILSMRPLFRQFAEVLSGEGCEACDWRLPEDPDRIVDDLAEAWKSLFEELCQAPTAGYGGGCVSPEAKRVSHHTLSRPRTFW